MPDIGDILSRARRREHSVTICLAGDLAAELDRLDGELQRAADWRPDSLGDEDPRGEIAERIQAVREEMRAAEITFTFRALGAKAWSDIIAQHPAKDQSQAFDAESLAPALVAASSVDPVMSREQVEELFEALNHAQREELMAAAWSVNGEATSVPFSLHASAILASRTAGK